MSIVSRGLDVASVPFRAGRVKNAVEFATGGDNPVYSFPAQTPCVNQFLKIRKPALGTTPSYPMGFVPLKSAQVGSHAMGASLFNAPVAGPVEPLKVPIIRPTLIDYEGMTSEVNVDFPVPFDYNAGIRPSIRGLKIDPVSEPTAPMFRPVGNFVQAPPSVVGFYDVGADDLVQQIRGRM